MTAPLALEDPLEGANCHFCGDTADNFHVPDEVWAKVEPILGQHQACFKCFRIAAWHAGLRETWEVIAGTVVPAVGTSLCECVPERIPYDQPQTWYFTFGVGGENAGRYYVVEDATGAEARDRIVSIFGRKWAFQYDEADWFKHGVSQAEKYGLTVIK